jgi:endogenous inhibitor of DNA gyrase (YacG/DUF329 family)
MSEKVIKVNCPKCKKEFSYYTSDHRPFCSEKCKMIDMGNWFNETYTVPGKKGSVYIEDDSLLKDYSDDEDI